MSSWFLLFAIAGALMFIGHGALRFQGIPRVLILAQVVFWSLSYLLRPAILLVVNPAPNFADYIADPRLGGSDGYELALRPVLTIVLVGLVAYALAIHILARRHSSVGVRTHDRPSSWGPAFGVAYLVGFGFRLVWLEAPELGVAGFISGLASTAAAGYVITASREQRLSRTFTVLVVVGELAWSVVFASKTPAIAIGLAFAVRFAADRGWRRMVVSCIAASIPFVFAFAYVQGLKTSADESSAFETNATRYPPAVQPLLPVARRFDLVSGIVDGMYARQIHWMPPSRFIQTIVESVLPQPLTGVEKTGAGVRWASEVSGPSIGTSRSDVSLAEGPIGEGYALGGYAGVIALAVLLAWATLGVARCLASQSLFAATVGARLISNALLFERGVLGGVEQLVRAVELAFCLAVIAHFASVSVKREEARR